MILKIDKASYGVSSDWSTCFPLRLSKTTAGLAEHCPRGLGVWQWSRSKG
jgi:hypothetical protein